MKTNKGERNLIAKKKQKKRLKNYSDADQMSERQKGILKNHSTLCSCFMCSGEKYKKPKYKNYLNDDE